MCSVNKYHETLQLKKSEKENCLTLIGFLLLLCYYEEADNIVAKLIIILIIIMMFLVMMLLVMMLLVMMLTILTLMV